MDIVTYALLNGKIKNYDSNVDEWLEENVDPATGYVLDRSLQMENAAAPADIVGDINDDVGELRNTSNNKADVIYDTASGPIASFPDGADGLPVKALTVAIEPVQSGTGDPSPTNVRPISGWTGCNISHSGADTSDPTVIPISWATEAGTVYGGTLDVTSGVLTVDRVMVASTWGDGVNAIDRGNNITSKKYELQSTAKNINATAAGDTTNVTSVQIFNTTGNVHFFIGSDNFAVLFLPQGTLASQEIQILYELATPQTYQLDPVTVQTLLGQNSIFADCGPSTVEYPADTKLYIQKINTPSDDDMIADAQIASGKYFIVNNNLYLSTTAILAGDPIKPGTNCTLTNLAAALNALNS